MKQFLEEQSRIRLRWASMLVQAMVRRLYLAGSCNSPKHFTDLAPYIQNLNFNPPSLRTNVKLVPFPPSF